MAVRIRKLAKNLQRSPAEVIGVLHALGYERYRSEDDMISEVVEAKLRRGLERGVQPAPVQLPAAPARDNLESVASVGDDLMSNLVPGVVPARPRGRPSPRGPRVPGRPPAPSQARPSIQAAPLVGEASSPSPRHEVPSVHEAHPEGELKALRDAAEALESRNRQLASERVVLEAEQEAIEAERARVEAQQRSVDRQRAAIEELRAELERERATLAAERAALTGRKQREHVQAMVGLEGLLEARGLRGADEFERALVALAQGRHLRDVLWSLKVEAPEPFQRLLRERLLLVAGTLPDDLQRGSAVVRVAPERAEVPELSELQRRVGAVGERLMLHGMRRVCLVGGAPRWQRMLRGSLDARIELRFAPSGIRDASAASDDVGWGDVVVLWDTDPGEAARAIYESGRPMLVIVDDARISGLLDGLVRALDA